MTENVYELKTPTKSIPVNPNQVLAIAFVQGWEYLNLEECKKVMGILVAAQEREMSEAEQESTLGKEE